MPISTLSSTLNQGRLSDTPAAADKCCTEEFDTPQRGVAGNVCMSDCYLVSPTAYLVTECIASARRATFLVLTPAMLMRPFLRAAAAAAAAAAVSSSEQQ
jgi:hypothetical protein